MKEEGQTARVVKRRRKAFIYIVLIPGIVLPALVMGIAWVDGKGTLGAWTGYLPHINAYVNTLTACCLLLAYFSIRRKSLLWHRRWMVISIGLGIVFFVHYILYHISNPATIYGDANGNGVLEEMERWEAGYGRSIYIALLISHIVSANFVVFLVLWALFHTYTRRFKRHKRVARYAILLWLYVSISGVCVYFMIRSYY